MRKNATYVTLLLAEPLLLNSRLSGQEEPRDAEPTQPGSQYKVPVSSPTE